MICAEDEQHGIGTARQHIFPYPVVEQRQFLHRVEYPLRQDCCISHPAIEFSDDVVARSGEFPDRERDGLGHELANDLDLFSRRIDADGLGGYLQEQPVANTLADGIEGFAVPARIERMPGIGIANMLNLLNPKAVVIGGGISGMTAAPCRY